MCSVRKYLMKFVFVSNYINHHQKPFCDALYDRLGDEFCFVQTMPMEEERVAMGWDTSLAQLPYVRLLYEDTSVQDLIYDAECVLFGWSEREDIAQKRILSGRPTLRVSERLYRDGRYKAISPRGLIAKYIEHIRFRKMPVYMLCAGAYTAADFSLIHAYPGKCLKWGYFPPFREFSSEALRSMKQDASKAQIQIVWAGRFIPLKNAEYAIRLAHRLQSEGIDYHLHMVGSGELENELKDMADRLSCAENISWYGFLNPDEVRNIMETSHIHLCTSNQLEGWGAVVNEGMNSGCIEIVSDRMGAVPFLIKSGENGLTYSRDSYEEMERVALEAIRGLMDGNPKYIQMGEMAYATIRNEWNSEVAAGRLMKIVDELCRAYKLSEEPIIELPQTGPLSIAPDIKLG